MTNQAQLAHPPVLYGKPGGVSWQARLLNAFLRHAIKHRIRRRGVSPRAARSVVRWLELISPRLHDLATVRRVDIAGVPCDVVHPLNPPPTERVVLYLHGGGFFTHLPRSYRRFARRISEALGATVYLPDYRLAPEHRYPAATNDCLATAATRAAAPSWATLRAAIWPWSPCFGRATSTCPCRHARCSCRRAPT
jgi:acetyl esterase/lipase